MIRVVDWFSGIGGFTLGLEMAGGFETVAFCENDPYACRVLEKHWPEVPNLGDIKNVRVEDIPEADMWTGGWPCQPHSLAGHKRGSEDERDLWPLWSRLIRTVRPCLMFCENVPGVLTSDGGGYWNRVLSDLAEAGFDAEWTTISASSFGTPFDGERLYLLASSHEISRPKRVGVFRELVEAGPIWPAPDASNDRDFKATASDIVGMDDGVPPALDRLQCLGNAVVPQVVAWIGERIRGVIEDGSR